MTSHQFFQMRCVLKYAICVYYNKVTDDDSTQDVSGFLAVFPVTEIGKSQL